MARRFEFEEGGSSKFWEVSVEGADMTVNYGRIGTSGQSKTKTFASDAAAQKEADKLVAEKTKKGYVEVGGDAPAQAAQATPKAAPSAKASSAKAPPTATPAAAAASEAAPPAPSPSIEGPSMEVDGEKVTFAPPAFAIEEAQPALSVPMRPRKAGTFDQVWGTTFARDAKTGRTWGPGETPEEQARLDKLHARFESKKEAPGPFDQELEALSLALGRHARIYPPESTTLAQRALAYWTAKTDPETALRTLLASDQYEMFVDPNGFRRQVRAVWHDEAGRPISFAREVREHLRQYGPEALAPVVRERVGPTGLRAWILDDEEGALADLEAFRANPHHLGGQIASLVPASDAALLLPHAPLPDAMRAVLRHGIALAPAVLALVPQYRERETATLLACYPSLAAARKLVALLESKSARKLVSEALAHMPEHAIVALREAKKQRIKYKDAVESLLSTLTAERGDGAAATDQIEAPLSDLPPVFTRAPWRQKKRAKLTTLPGLVVQPVPRAIDVSGLDPAMFTKERAMLARHAWTLEQITQAHASGRWVGVWNLIGSTVPTWQALQASGKLLEIGWSSWTHDAWTPGLTTLLDMHGTPFIDLLVAIAPKLKPALAGELEYAGAVEVAPLAVQWVGKKNARKAAVGWVRRFPHHAAAGLLPIALGAETKATDRDRAITLLAYLAEQRDVVLEEAARLHPEAVEAAKLLLDRDPLESAPSKPPKLFDGLEHLPRVALNDGRVLSADAQSALLEMLAFSPIDAPYEGLAQVKDACDPRSLDVFVEALVRAWVAAGMASAHEWAVRAVALIGSDRAARFLFDRSRAWANDSQKQRAILALDVLGAMGTDLALSLVGRMSRSGQRQYLKDRAVEILAEVAEQRNLSAEELEDRTAPDLGLDENGTMILDFGPRKFLVGFDEHLMPFVKNEARERLDALPRANKSDDTAMAKAAWDAWKLLRSEAEKVAKDQVARLERLLGDERRLDAEVFMDAFVKHPLIGHLAQRLVWGAYGADGALLATFRVAEDRSLATVDEDGFELPSDATVGLMHPLRMKEQAADLSSRWGQVFADYALVQPFAQLARSTEVVDLAEILRRYGDRRSTAGLLFGLRNAGWRAQYGEYADVEGYAKSIGNQDYTLRIDPPIAQGQGSGPRPDDHAIRLTASADPSQAGPTEIQLSELALQLESIVLH